MALDKRKVNKVIRKALLQSKFKKKKMLSGGQAKLDKNNNNRIDAQDFKILRAEKAKGRGMGLQDEKVKPGKVMKAKKGKLVPLKSDPTKAITSVKPSVGGKGGPPKKTPKEARSAVEDFIKRRKKLSGIGRVGRIGAAAALLGLAGAGAASLGQKIGRKYFGDPTKNEKNKMSMPIKKKNKKMGGGMMKRPMAYTKGGGADTGSRGELKSKLGVLINKVKRDNEMLKKRRPKLQAPERGPMKPLQAKKGRTISTRGGGVDSGTFGRIRDAGPFRPLPTTPPGGFKPMDPETSQRLKKLMDRKNRREKIKDVVRQGSKLLPGVGALELGKRVYEKFGGQKQEPREKGERPSRRGRMGGSRIKPDPSRNPNPKTPKMMGAMGGGMMMKPMGYKSGTSVKVKCKLGRNKPTKMY